ncbi:fibroblast growth factor 17 [Bacillus rossius redtenbacheri]|uniref:fibroblast growth factor 17 n=1 Tax=Bacillus rossius redtenbacheri TaxID=93214 RepID=UPI002FDD73DB
MLLTVYTLPQLAVSAKLLCLLMVVICGAVPSMVRSVRLYNQCSCSTVRVNKNGSVLASESIPEMFENLTIQSHDFTVKLTIFAEASKRYLCFNKRWRLVGLPSNRGPHCEFREDMDTNGYNTYRSVANEAYFAGFNSRGRPLGRKKAARANSTCVKFLKKDSEFDISHHNQQVSALGRGYRRKQQATSNKHPRRHQHHRGGGGRSKARRPS